MKITFCPRCGTRFVCPNLGTEGYLCWCKPLFRISGGPESLDVEFPVRPCLWGDYRTLWEYAFTQLLEGLFEGKVTNDL